MTASTLFVRRDAIAHSTRLQESVNVTFLCTGKPKIAFASLYDGGHSPVLV